MKSHDVILAAYRRTMQRSDWLETRQLSWRKRLKRHLILTIWYAIIDRFWKVSIALGLHDSFLWAHTFWGDRMQVTFPDYRSIYHHGLIDGRELPVENFLVQFLQDGDVFIDVGANVGFYTLLASVLVGESGSVHAFEPTPRTFAVLTANSANKKNVTRVTEALMEREGKRNLVDYGIEKSGTNAILPDSDPSERAHGDIRETTLSVEATTLDSYCLTHDVRPTFIKIDTEGAEEMVLQGGHQTLTKFHPVLIVEVQLQTVQNVVALLVALGYHAYHFSGNIPVPYANENALLCPNMLFTYD